jgi:hypothetical protein
MGYNLKKAADNDSSGDFQALPAGRYTLQVEDADVQSSSTGKPMIAVTFTVVSGEFANRKLWHNFTITEKALPFLTRFLKACGSNIIEEEDVEAYAIAQDMLKKVVTAYTEPGKTINGNPKNDLKNWKSVKEASGLDDDTASADDELFS